jgi:hypothetical protein
MNRTRECVAFEPEYLGGTLYIFGDGSALHITDTLIEVVTL